MHLKSRLMLQAQNQR